MAEGGGPDEGSRRRRPRSGDEPGRRPRRRAGPGASDGDAAEREPRAEDGQARRPRRLGARAVARAAVEQVVEMTGKAPEGVTAVSPNGQGWLVGVEVVETERIPSSADVLAIYDAELDAEGELLSYRRVKRYTRGRGDDE